MVSGKILKVGPPSAHVCALPPLWTLPDDTPVDVDLIRAVRWVPTGTVWQCDCGDAWVVRWIPDRVSTSWVECAHSEWQRETRRERKRRLRNP